MSYMAVSILANRHSENWTGVVVDFETENLCQVPEDVTRDQNNIELPRFLYTDNYIQFRL